MKIEIKKVLRDCPYNKTAKVEGRRLLYDREVWIDQEHRATWRPASYARGFTLYDVGSECVEEPWGKDNKNLSPVKANGLAELVERTIAIRQFIPTIKQIQERKLELAAKEAAEEAARIEQEKIKRVRDGGQQEWNRLTTKESGELLY
jgi:hypothetical protein